MTDALRQHAAAVARDVAFGVSAEAFVQRAGSDGVEHANDLILAMACESGDASALAAFGERYEAEIDLALSRLGVDVGTMGDVKSTVLERLLVSSPSRLSRYSGRGSLAAWVKAVVAREVMSVRRTAARRRDLLDAAGDALAPADPELVFLKQHYRGAFRQAFAAAVGALSDQERLLLRYRFVDELTLPQVAAACGVHRATAARRLAALRTELFEGTRDRLSGALNVAEDELASILRLIQSNFDVSMRRLL